MAQDTATFFIRAIEVMALYSLMITLLVHSIPSEDLTYVYELQGKPAYSDLDNISSKFQESIGQQRSFGVVEAGALALTSGNILMDLILNFFGAVPSMASIIVNGILIFLNVANPLKNALLTFVTAIIGIIYIIGIILLVVNIRSGTSGSL